MDCAFFGFRILADYIYTDAFTTRLFASFLWVFSRFLVSSPGASWPGRRRSRRLTSVILCVRTPGLKRAVPQSSPQFRFAFNYHRVSLIFGRRRLALAGGLVAIWRAVAVLYK